MRHELDIGIQLDRQNIRCLKEAWGCTRSLRRCRRLQDQGPRNLQRFTRSTAEGLSAEAMLLQMEKRPLPEIEAYLRRAVQLNPHLYRAVVDLLPSSPATATAAGLRPSTSPAPALPPTLTAPDVTAISPSLWLISSTGTSSMQLLPRLSAAFRTMPRPSISPPSPCLNQHRAAPCRALSSPISHRRA